MITGNYIDPNVLIAPSLRSLLPLNVLEPPIQSSNLTALELEFYGTSDMPFESFVAILHCAANLHTLSLINSGPLFSPETVIKPLPLVNLRNFSLGRLSTEYVSKLIHLVFAPGLKKLSLDFKAEDGNMTALIAELTKPIVTPDHILGSTWPTNLRSDDLTRPASLISHLTELNLFGLTCDADAEQVLYRACPDVRRLYTDMRRLTMAFATPIMSRSNLLGRTPLDRLEEWSVAGFAPSSIVEVIQTRRRWRLPALKRLRIDKRITLKPSELTILEAILPDVSFTNLMLTRRDELDPRIGQLEGGPEWVQNGAQN